MHAYKLASHTLAHVTLPVTCTKDFSVACFNHVAVSDAPRRGGVYGYVGISRIHTSLKHV